MAYTYRFVIDGAEASSNGDVHLDTWIERSEDAENWTRDVPNGHFTVVLDGNAVIAIADGEGTDAEKIAAFAAMFKEKVQDKGIEIADDAVTKLESLVSWPQTVAL